MNVDESRALIDELEDLLEAEREALIGGQLDRLPALLERKEVLIERMNATAGLSIDELQPLRGKVLRNQVLLDGALRGIRNVASRFSALRRIRSTFETYDDRGRKAALLEKHDNKLEKRA